MSNRQKRPRLVCSGSTVFSAYPFYDPMTYTDARQGSEYATTPSGIEDAWIVADDEMLKGTIRFIPATGSEGYSSGWDEWQQFIHNARRKEPVTFLPDGFAAVTESFAVDNSSLWTMQGTGLVTWNTGSNELFIISGSSAQYVTNANFKDGYVEVDTYAANQGGLIARYQNNNNFYFVRILDDLTPTSANLLLRKRVNGTFSSIGSTYNFVWASASLQTIRFEVTGTTLNTYLNGVLVLSEVDTDISGSGKVGFYNNHVAGSVGTRYTNLNIVPKSVASGSRCDVDAVTAYLMEPMGKDGISLDDDDSTYKLDIVLRASGSMEFTGY